MNEKELLEAMRSLVVAVRCYARMFRRVALAPEPGSEDGALSPVVSEEEIEAGMALGHAEELVARALARLSLADADRVQ